MHSRHAAAFRQARESQGTPGGLSGSAASTGRGCMWRSSAAWWHASRALVLPRTRSSASSAPPASNLSGGGVDRPFMSGNGLTI